MRKVLAILAAMTLVTWPLAISLADTKEQDRLENCGSVLEEIMNIPDNLPANLIDKAECVIVIPSVVKVAVGFGGAYGRGAMICRSGEQFTGPWGAPTMMALEGGSFGFQLGFQATDFLILVMNPRGATAILKNKVKLGADVSVTIRSNPRRFAMPILECSSGPWLLLLTRWRMGSTDQARRSEGMIPC